jgi:hypothetical protein
LLAVARLVDLLLCLFHSFIFFLNWYLCFALIVVSGGPTGEFAVVLIPLFFFFNSYLCFVLIVVSGGPTGGFAVVLIPGVHPLTLVHSFHVTL